MSVDISVVMAVCNEEKFLSPAVESILNQTYANFEFIIVDDASTDGTPEILEEFSRQDSRIRILRNEKTLRLPGSLNRGIEISQGKWIARMDGDDISLPTRFEDQINYLKLHPEINILSTWVTRITPQGEKIVDWTMDEEHSLIMWRIPFTTPVYHASAFLNKEFIQKRGMYNPDAILEDIDLWTRVADEARFGCVPKCLYLYRDSVEARKDKAVYRNPISNEIRRNFIENYVGYPVSIEMYENLLKSRLRITDTDTILNEAEALEAIRLIGNLNQSMKNKGMLIEDELPLVDQLLMEYMQNLINLTDEMKASDKYKIKKNYQNREFWRKSELPIVLQGLLFFLFSPVQTLSIVWRKLTGRLKRYG